MTALIYPTPPRGRHPDSTPMLESREVTPGPAGPSHRPLKRQQRTWWLSHRENSSENRAGRAPPTAHTGGFRRPVINSLIPAAPSGFWMLAGQATCAPNTHPFSLSVATLELTQRFLASVSPPVKWGDMNLSQGEIPETSTQWVHKKCKFSFPLLPHGDQTL